MLYRDIAVATLSSETLYNFPWPVTETGFPDDYWSQGLASGMDRYFIDINGNMLDREVELFDSIAKRQIIWIRLPSNSPTLGSLIRMPRPDGVFRANSTATWEVGFLAVLNGKLNGTSVPDGTANGLNGTAVNMNAADQIDAALGKGLLFNGIDKYVSLGNGALLNLTGAYTYEALVYANPAAAGAVMGRYTNGFSPSQALLRLETNGAFRGFHIDRFTPTLRYNDVISATGQAGAWKHVALTFAPGVGSRLVLNGVQAELEATAPNSALSSTLATMIGRQDHATAPLYCPFRGTKFRISNVARSLGWCLASARALLLPGGYCTVGAEQSDTITLGAADVASAPSIDGGSLTQTHRLGAADLTVIPVLEAEGLVQTHRLGAADLAIVPILDAGPLSVESGGLGSVINPKLVSITPARRLQSVTPARRLQSATPHRKFVAL